MASRTIVGVHPFAVLVALISVMFVGHHGRIASFSCFMATSFASVYWFQAYVLWSKAVHLLAIQMQRAMIVLLLVKHSLSVIWLTLAPILKLRQDTTGLQFLAAKTSFSMMLTSGITHCSHIGHFVGILFPSRPGKPEGCSGYSVVVLVNVLLLAPLCQVLWFLFQDLDWVFREALRNMMTFILLQYPLCHGLPQPTAATVLDNPIRARGAVKVSLHTMTHLQLPLNVQYKRKSWVLTLQRIQKRMLVNPEKLNDVLHREQLVGLLIGWWMILIRDVFGDMLTSKQP
nr:protein DETOXIFICATION 16-like [Ipomoea batatas]